MVNTDYQHIPNMPRLLDKSITIDLLKSIRKSPDRLDVE